MDTLQRLGAAGLRHAPSVLNEVAQAGQKFAQLAPAETVSRIAQEAQACANPSKGRGLAAVISKVESSFHHFDDATARGRIIALESALRGISGRLQPARDLAQETLDAVTLDLPILQVLVEISGQTPSAALVTRRQELLLTSCQQLRMAIQQIENLQKQVDASRQSLEELRTVTLPALGFLQSIR